MAKTSSLSSDIDIIKEFEELKLKQKLLIESLKKNSDSQQNRLFLEINSKLDFLVKIFTESINSEEEDEKIDYNAKFEEILGKINDLSQNFEEKISDLDKKIVKSEMPKVKVPEISIPVDTKVDLNKNLNEVSKEPIKVIQPPVIENKKSDELPPVPNFESKIDDIQKEDADKKKRKWF